jgi:hypothetical protein
MGFFSWQCKSPNCDCSVLSKWVTNDVNDWMTETVVVTAENKVFRGEYDGYGRVIDDPTFAPLDVLDSDDIYHEACWELAGSPTDNRGGSDAAADQGFFIDDGAWHRDYLRPDPRLNVA